MKLLVGFIGQGYIGKNYADDFEKRGFEVIRYAVEEPFSQNKDRIGDCDIVFIAVPTPTSNEKFDVSIVKQVLRLVGKGKIAVLKSTIIPGTTAKLQEEFPDIVLLYSPEFLREVSAAEDAANPFSNIIGMSVTDEIHEKAAATAHEILPKAPYTLTCTSTQAEIIKYAHNGSGYVEIIFFNLMYDLANSLGTQWPPIEEALQADPYIAHRYAKPLHKSGRGAGGHCFIKDFAALRALYSEKVGDTNGTSVLTALEEKNKELLKSTNKDLDLLRGVYGDAS